MKQLTDIRTETQRWAADFWYVIQNVKLTGIELQNLISVAKQMGVTSWVNNDWSTFAKPKGWYAGGGDFMVNKPTVIGVGEAGTERVQITPAGKGGATAGRQLIFNNCNFRDVNDVYRALEQADRGL